QQDFAEGTFARAGSTDYRDLLTRLDLEIDIAENIGRFRIIAKEDMLQRNMAGEFTRVACAFNILLCFGLKDVREPLKMRAYKLEALSTTGKRYKRRYKRNGQNIKSEHRANWQSAV